MVHKVVEAQQFLQRGNGDLTETAGRSSMGWPIRPGNRQYQPSALWLLPLSAWLIGRNQRTIRV
jgi:hypothetical protein